MQRLVTAPKNPTGHPKPSPSSLHGLDREDLPCP
jgi:hypothetical protein